MEVVHLKIYDFTNRKREWGCVVFALALDKKKLAERIIIGKVDEVRRILNGGDGEIYYDEVRPLGSLLLSFESDPNGDWNKNHLLLRESYGKDKIIRNTKKVRWEMATPVQAFLQSKYESGEPSVMFAAVRTWDEYINPLNEKAKTADAFTGKLHMLYKPFRVYDKYKPWHELAVKDLSVAIPGEESAVELWYPVKKRIFETVVAALSFLPLIFYYTHKIKEWGYVFQQCKICDAHFLARSRHYELCSDKCRRKQAAIRKHEHEERYKDDDATAAYDRTYYHWYNRLKKLRKGKLANPKQEALFSGELKKFCDEGKKLKTAVQKRKMNFSDYSTWLAQQANLADDLMDNFAADKME
jgi:hypothetical protein